MKRLLHTIVVSILERGANLNVNTKYGQETALGAAVSWGNSIEVVRWLLEKGANPNILDSSGLGMPLHNAFSVTDETSVMELLIRYGADVNSTDSYLKRTPLHYAAKYNKPNAVKLLLDHGASTSVRDEKGDLPIDLANDENVIALLRDYRQPHR
ncbi:hypothetical protein ES703_78225 [subsurface metagenome]